MSRNPLAKTLDELDPPAWTDPTGQSHLVTTCHRLRSKPLSAFTVEDLRIMIGQGIGLPHLLPLALDVIEKNPLAAGDMYPGDLLASALTVDKSFWGDHPQYRERMEAILGRTNVPSTLRKQVAAFHEQTVRAGT